MLKGSINQEPEEIKEIEPAGFFGFKKQEIDGLQIKEDLAKKKKERPKQVQPVPPKP